MTAPLRVIAGPTASGKSALAVELAERIGAEIVSADSQAVYRHFDIGTAKPTAEQRSRVPHHLVSCVEPDEPFSAARFGAMADEVIKRSVVACDYAMPSNPDGGKIDPKTAVVEYTSGPNKTNFSQVANLQACADDMFYIDGDRIKLCPIACGKVQADEAAEVMILFGCEPKDQPTN